MSQIPGFAIVVIFVIAMATVVSNRILVSSVSKLLLETTSDSFTTVSQNAKENLEPQSWYDLPETVREPPKCLVNLHIPKVGGRTVGTFLQQVTNITGFERFSLYGHKGEQAWEDIVQAKRSLIQEQKSSDSTHHTDTHNQEYNSNNKQYFQNFFVQGHFSARIFDVYPELKECLIMTVLRQPVDRAISAFFFHNHKRNEIDKCLSSDNYKSRDDDNTDEVTDRSRHREEDGPPGLVIQRGNATILMSSAANQSEDLKAGARSRLVSARTNAANRLRNQRCKLFWQYSNDMTLRFAGLPELPWKSWEMSERGRKWRKDKNKHQAFEQARIKRMFSVSSIPQINETHLARAQENMKYHMGLVCFLHDLPSCAQRILQAFQLLDSSAEIDVSIMSPNRTTKFKTKSRPDQLEEEEFQKFQEANRLDQLLYDWALEKYS